MCPEDFGLGTSLAVQWLRIPLPMQGMWVRSLIWELRSHMQVGSCTATGEAHVPKLEKAHT